LVVDNHHHVNGVEVFLTSEAAGEVGLLVRGGMKFRAQRAEKAQIVLRVFERELEDGGHKIVNEYLISKCSYECGREALPAHCYFSFVA
jgi:hypothetical protein